MVKNGLQQLPIRLRQPSSSDSSMRAYIASVPAGVREISGLWKRLEDEIGCDGEDGVAPPSHR